MSHTKPPLWKQLLGAVTGAALAMALYQAVTVVSPRVTAYLTTAESRPQSAISVSTVRTSKKTDQNDLKRLVSKQQQAQKAFEEHQEEIKRAAAPQEPAPVSTEEVRRSVQRTLERQQQMAAEQASAQLHEASGLPDTGVGLWTACILAFCIAAGVRARKQMAFLFEGR